MFCSQCGTQLTADTRFCPKCGAAFSQAPPGGYPQQSRLYRPRHPRVIGGVCSGLALHYGWDITLVRVLWALCILFAGTGLLAYVIAWIVIPEAPNALPAKSL
jgi:phage shock protein C